MKPPGYEVDLQADIGGGSGRVDSRGGVGSISGCQLRRGHSHRALGNALGSFDFPSVFRGDGAAFVVPPDSRMIATTCSSRLSRSGKCLGLELRAGLRICRDIYRLQPRRCDVHAVGFLLKRSHEKAEKAEGAKLLPKRPSRLPTPSESRPLPDDRSEP